MNTEEFRKIVLYLQGELMKQLIPSVHQNGYPCEAVPKAVLLSIDKMYTLDSYLKAIGEKKVRSKPQVQNEAFEQWWSTYPSSANFTYRGMAFRATRSLRSNKDVCARLYQATIAEGVTPETLLKALNTQVQLMKEESYEKVQNQLQYMSATEPYLRQRKWEAFVDIEGETTSDNSYETCA